MITRFLLVIVLIFLQSDLAAQPKWHTYAYSGYAWSKKAGIVNPAPLIFANVAPSDTDDSSLSNANFVGIALHHDLNKWQSLGLSYESYATFNYQKYHENGSPMQDNLGSVFLRLFFMNHQSVMLESYLKMPKHWQVQLGGLKVTPLVGLGVGVGINNLFNFQALSYDADIEGTEIASIAKNNIEKSFAWRIETGLNFASLSSNVSFGLAYRYYDGGRFATSNFYLFNIAQGFAILPPWTGKFKTNQIKMYINVNFD